MNFTAFLSYVILTAITPGPNNIMSMSNASRYGFRRSLPFNFGVFAGFIAVMSASALFSSLLYNVMPSVKPFMLCVGAAYILWLAWTVWRDTPHGEGERQVNTNTFLSGMTLQFVNVKVILYCITTMSCRIITGCRSSRPSSYSSPSSASPARSAGRPSARSLRYFSRDTADR